MGCPDIYYKRALQYFAHCLAYLENKKLAKELSEETSESKLEEFILCKKSQTDEKKFFYDAGRTCQYVLDEAESEGTDAMNASVAGICQFEHLIGIREKEE